MFGREFSALLLLALAVAAPFAWWLMNRWLENFTYRIEVGAGVFMLTIGITFAVALFAFGFKTFKTAGMNPVESLRSE